MKNQMKAIILILFVLHFTSCTIVHYKITNELAKEKSHTHSQCDINYFLVFTSGIYTNTFGDQKDSDKRALELQKKYEESIEKVLSYKGCKINKADSANAANFIIQVKRQLFMSALPQEWLTGLSFGIIPSWGTRPEQFVYTFEDKKTGTKHSYIIDEKSYNHLVLFPVFLFTYSKLTEFNVFEETFTNFIENT